MKRHRDELFNGIGPVVPDEPAALLAALCTYLTQSSGREVRLMLEEFPPDTVSGLWIDMGDFDVVAVEAQTSPLHQIVILGHELWHRKEGGCGGHHGSAAGVVAAARMLGERWDLSDVVARVAARTDGGIEEERRAERFGRMLATKFRPYLNGAPGRIASDGVTGRIWASLEG
ncbi:toxin-antitoxin system, toxin component [Streptomyces flavotricini]|uniref:Toxin-antitoxin system, toxin component n=1 Tax=Streptomyces flavotricini TaxID=66888 RepID=A0ABS8E9I3_9ACTN|nr:toxin-antitoxin system, toxin component [Streptomyces flavotricini]MCC0097665.1 toxin-antitoxin system, toxin component [Streptomyces flavotricini]